ncbi:MAG: thioredoxin [archaeon]|nr:thioredoxin [archaeon]
MTIPNGVISIGSIDAFNDIVNKYKENLIIVDFYADWCGPCKSFMPVYTRTQQEYFSKGVIFARLNTDHLPEVANQFNIQGVPSLMIIRNKKGLKKHVGALNRKQLKKLIDSFL